jgi:hypothetical protein
MSDSIHTFNINIHEVIDRTAKNQGLGDETSLINSIKEKVPETIGIADPNRSKYVDTVAREAGRISPEFDKELRKELTKITTQAVATSMSTVSADIAKNVYKIPNQNEMMAKQAAVTPDAILKVSKGFDKFKSELFNALTSTLELEVGNKFKLLGNSVDTAFKRLGNIERLRVVDVNALKGLLNERKVDVSSTESVTSIYNKAVTDIVKEARGVDSTTGLTQAEARSIYQHISKYGYSGGIKEVSKFKAGTEDDFVRGITEFIKKATPSKQDSTVNRILAETIHSRTVADKLSSVVHNIDIPRYEVTAGGVPVTRTSKGSMRVVSPHVKFESGLMVGAKEILDEVSWGPTKEDMRKAILQNDLKKIEEYSSMMFELTKNPYPPNRHEYVGINEDAVRSSVINAGGKVLGNDYLSMDYINKKVVREGVNRTDLMERALKYLDKELKNKQVPVSEVFHAMSTVEDTTLYDEILTNLRKQTRGRSSPLVRFAQGLANKVPNASTLFMRDITEKVKDLEQYYPERPTSILQANKGTKVITPYLVERDNTTGRLQPAEQVQELKAVNYLISKASKYTGDYFSTLGASEGKASSFKDASSGKEVIYNMYRGDVSKDIPFGALRHEGRNVFAVQQARQYHYIDEKGRVKADLPRVRAVSENAAIESGLFNKQGYGLNLVTKFKDSAEVFEDQILIAGKVMRGFTTTIKNIIGDVETLNKLKNEPELSGKLAQKIVSKSPMMGEVKLNTSADAITVGKVGKILSTSTSIDRATAQIVNTVFSSLSTKISTRYGSKGTVSFTTAENLGYQERPLSVSEMLTKLMENKPGSSKALEYAGKYGVMPFIRGAGANSTIARRYGAARKEINKVLRAEYGIKLEQKPEMVTELQQVIEKTFGKKALKVKVPIDAQISLTGITKRLNFGAELAEMMAGTISGGSQLVIPSKGLKQASLYRQFNKMGKLMGYGTEDLSKYGMQPINFVSNVTSKMWGTEPTIAGTKFFAVTGEKNENAAIPYRDIKEGKRGISLNPSGASAYLSRYGIDSEMGSQVLTRFMGDAIRKEKAKQYRIMRNVTSDPRQVRRLIRYYSQRMTVHP